MNEARCARADPGAALLAAHKSPTQVPPTALQQLVGVCRQNGTSAASKAVGGQCAGAAY